MKSLWLDGYDDNNYVSLDKDINCDVLIIGGGITGLSTLYNLKDSNLNIVLVEANLVGSGITGHTTGKINYLQELIYSDIKKKHNYETAKLYYESQIEAINKIKEIIKKEKISCDFEQVKSSVYTNKKEDIKKIQKEKELLLSFNAKVEEEYKNFGKYQISVNDTYVFHPIKYLQELKKICQKKHKIYEKTKIVKIEEKEQKYYCYTNKYKITASKVILACHYPYFLLPYFLPLKANIEKSYISASLKKHDHKTYITSGKPTTSIRYHQDYLIYLNNSSSIASNLSEKDNFEDNIKNVNDLPIEYIWKNDDLITVDHIPYIGTLKKDKLNLLIATGYNTWGMTNGTLAGLILSDLILNKENKYALMCDPTRVNNLKYLNNFLINSYNSMKGLILSKLNKNKSFYNSNVTFKKINGENLAIYKENDKEYIIYNKCPHMGCSLIFNEVDKTWDCPCHASRFSKEGICIKGPSVKNITYDKH